MAGVYGTGSQPPTQVGYPTGSQPYGTYGAGSAQPMQPGSGQQFGTYHGSQQPMMPPQGSTGPQIQTTKQVAGVGIHFTPNHEGMQVVTGMRPGGPAESCGRILVGDILWKVDDVAVKGHSIQSVIGMLTGPVDSTVTLSILDGKFPYLPAKLCQCQRASLDSVGVIQEAR